MSPSARRLAPDTETLSFDWQGRESRGGDTGLVTLFPHQPRPAVGSLALPSVAAERLAAAVAEARATGQAEGTRAGQQAAASQAAGLLKNLAAALGDIAALRSEMMRRSERDVVRLAIAMAESILTRQVDVDRSRLLTMAQTAIARFGEQSTATIRLSPQDFQLLEAAGLPSIAGVRIEPDPSVPAYGCLVTTPFGEIDAGVSTQVRELSRALVGTSEITDIATGRVTPHGRAAGA